jgi:hypothetical protein
VNVGWDWHFLEIVVVVVVVELLDINVPLHYESLLLDPDLQMNQQVQVLSKFVHNHR